MMSQTTIPVRKYLRIALLILALLTLWFFRTPLGSAMAVLKDQQAVSTYMQRLGPLGPLALFVLLVAQVFVAVIPGHALMMAGGYVFGPVVAISVTAASTILGSQIAFLVARRYGRPIIYRLAKSNIIERWDHLAGRQGSLFFFFAFVLPIFPSDLMCYVAGLGKVSPRGFLAANFAGRLICAATITMIGVYGFQPPWQFWALVLGCMAVLFIAWGIYKYWGSRPRSMRELACALRTLLKKPEQSCGKVAICIRNVWKRRDAVMGDTSSHKSRLAMEKKGSSLGIHQSLWQRKVCVWKRVEYPTDIQHSLAGSASLMVYHSWRRAHENELV
jgi:uncharacterized membrane protein YdjX (TVP38/TMEM64 family)